MSSASTGAGAGVGPLAAVGLTAGLGDMGVGESGVGDGPAQLLRIMAARQVKVTARTTGCTCRPCMGHLALSHREPETMRRGPISGAYRELEGLSPMAPFNGQ